MTRMNENKINLVTSSAGLQYHILWKETSDVKLAADGGTLLPCLRIK
jgi:hypothetical protein